MLRCCLALAVSSLALACTPSSSTPPPSDASPNSRADPGEVMCPSIAKQPRALIDLGDRAISANGEYALTYAAGTESETCTLTVTNIAPSEQECVGEACTAQSPATRTETTCTGIEPSGIQDDGSIRYLQTAGTPERIQLTLTRAGETLVSGSAQPDYSPDECGFIEPVVTLGSE